jgi:hypothetical protein
MKLPFIYSISSIQRTCSDTASIFPGVLPLELVNRGSAWAVLEDSSICYAGDYISGEHRGTLADNKSSERWVPTGE